ncbi:MAG: FHA domain-containing protein [Myxococcaceae bacterium]|nr:FHA domain-containing protein [Myxococcaceae bacterium]
MSSLAGMPALLLLTGPSAGLRFEVLTEVTLGRSPTCGLPLDDSRVSRQHARFRLEGGLLKVEDLGSRNGTLVNGEQLHGEAVVRRGDSVQVGETKVLVEPTPRDVLREPGQTGGDEREAVPLRERADEAVAILGRIALVVARHLGAEPPRLGSDARRSLVDHRWPDDLQELRLLAERLVLLHPREAGSAPQLPPTLNVPGRAPPPRTLAERIRRLEREAIGEAMRDSGGTKIRAAALLGISRPTLDKKLEEYHLGVARKRRSR